MWNWENFGASVSLVYSIDDDDVIYINNNDDDTSNCQYIALIFSKDTNEIGHKFYSELFDNDLDVLKFKCLLLAKEYGWDVNIAGVK